jgi:hypothetical protein
MMPTVRSADLQTPVIFGWTGTAHFPQRIGHRSDAAEIRPRQ